MTSRYDPAQRWSDADQRDLNDRDLRREIADAEGINIDDMSDQMVEDHFQDPDDWGTNR